MSLKEMRPAEPCGHIWTHAGPAARPTHKSHFVASCLPSGILGDSHGGASMMLCQGQSLTQALHPMQVFLSIVTSSVPSGRLMAPVGHLVMHTGSVH